MRQRTTLLLIAALAVTGCQKKASGQTVAVVNDEEITAAELNDAMAGDTTLTGVDPKQARSAELQKLIDRKLLVQQARKDGFDKSPEFINRQRRLTDDLLIQMMVSKKVNTKELPSAAEISQFEAAHPGVFANREVWTLQQILYPLPQNAEVTKKLNDAMTLDEVAQILTSAHVQFQRATRKIDSASMPQQIYAQIAKLQPGEPFIAPGPGKAIANVITERQAAPVAGEQARAAAANGIRSNEAATLLQDRVKSLRGTAKIEYQPGFEPPKK